MEFSFEIPSWITRFVEEPMYIAIWATFGIFFSAMFLIIILSRIGKIFSISYIEKIIPILICAIMITWLIGFLTMIILLFIGISGIKMLLIWLSIFIGCFIFSIVNRKQIENFVKSLGKEKSS